MLRTLTSLFPVSGKFALFALLGLFFARYEATAAEGTAARKPNVVVILSDDKCEQRID